MNNKANLLESHETRKSYEQLPFQGFWTWLTGKANKRTKDSKSDESPRNMHKKQ